MDETAMTTLIAQVKRKLNITWSDPDTEARVADIIHSAAAHLTYQLGITADGFDFSAAGIENILFLAYCFYEWNHALDEFEDNYRGMIMSARAKYEVAQNHDSAAGGGDTDEDG